ncbi:MAG: formate dehydrogenase subunit gamma [Gammaproteobacteria bacterium]|nr:formate dehydrogenase subunit gamma [Gammaproteobacteria bacterium]
MLDSFRSSILYDVLKLTSTLLLVFMLTAPATAGPGPPKRPDFPQGVSTTNPGNDLWREVRQRDLPVTGTSQVKGVDSGVLINVEGDRWARFRIDNPVRHAPTLLVAVVLVLLAFYVLRGKVGIEGGLSGRMVFRFTDYERSLHWCLAIVFLFLAITGLILLLGRTLMIPLFGHHLFSLMASASKEGHNLFGPIFLVSLLLMLVSFARRNIYEKGDLTWLLKGGGIVGRGHVSSGFFNMGEKSWYWLVILVGLAISISGLILVFPNFGQGRVIMVVSNVVHVFGAIVLITVSIGHMYLGSIGTEGSSEGMKSGYVDINWAEAHHDRWAKTCHENDEILSAEEFARLQGNPIDSGDATTGAAND